MRAPMRPHAQVGDDSATAEFKSWWEDAGVVRGGLLVYNTGRSLQSFQQLLADKGHCLARPDVLISAVGTKVGLFCVQLCWGPSHAVDVECMLPVLLGPARCLQPLGMVAGICASTTPSWE